MLAPLYYWCQGIQQPACCGQKQPRQRGSSSILSASALSIHLPQPPGHTDPKVECANPVLTCRQTLLFSATMPRKVERLVTDILNNPITITVCSWLASVLH